MFSKKNVFLTWSHIFKHMLCTAAAITSNCNCPVSINTGAHRWRRAIWAHWPAAQQNTKLQEALQTFFIFGTVPYLI